MTTSPEHPTPLDAKTQQDAIRRVYETAAPHYDLWASETGPTRYTLLRITRELFSKYGIKKGSLLDVGAGTGPLKTLLGDNFDFTGIDISTEPLERARQKGYRVQQGSIEEILPSLTDASYEHVVALSCLYYIHPNNIRKILQELYRVSSKSLILSLDAVAPIREVVLQKTGAHIFDYSDFDLGFLPPPSEDSTTEAWTSPSAGIRVNARMLLWVK